ncbi:MAG TPA: sialidase family protein [Chthoniobacterales bacterium]
MDVTFLRLSAVTFLVIRSLAAQTAPYDSAKPLPKATVFAPGTISTGDYESHPTFAPDGHEIYFLKMAPNFSRWSIFVSRYENGSWSQPEVAPFSGQYQDADPFITADGKHFYFISDRPLQAGGQRQSNHDIWVMDKTDSGWSAPRHLPAPVNSDADEFYPIALKNGTLYFGSQRKEANGVGDIYRAVPQKDGGYAVENLGSPVNTEAGEYEAFVSEDERMMLLAITRRPDSLGDIDLYVSHKHADGKWGEPVNLGPEINSPARELSPKVTPDGKYLIWMSCRVPPLPEKPQRHTTDEVLQELHAPGNGLGDIYQIDISAVPALKPPN